MGKLSPKRHEFLVKLSMVKFAPIGSVTPRIRVWLFQKDYIERTQDEYYLSEKGRRYVRDWAPVGDAAPDADGGNGVAT